MKTKKSRLPAVRLPDIESENEEEGNCVYASEKKLRLLKNKNIIVIYHEKFFILYTIHKLISIIIYFYF